MSRRHARALALQVLYHIDVGRADPERALSHAFVRDIETEEGSHALSERDAGFARLLVTGAWSRRDSIDEIIARYARDWSVERMAAVDRNLLRLAIYEILEVNDVPDSVAADEAVELAKEFSTADSSKFINGILGSVIRSIGQEAPSVEPTIPGH